MSKTPSTQSSNPHSFSNPSFEERLESAYRSVYAIPFRGDIWEYLESNARLPHSVRTTRVDRNISPWIIQPVRDIISRQKHEQTVVKPVQGSGTTIIDLLIQHIVDQDPGECWLNMQKKEAADGVAESRFMPLLEKNARTRILMPTDKTKIRKNEIVFDHMKFKVQGATVNNLQSTSVPWVINDEIWLWKDIGLLTMARARTTAVWNGSVVNVSQGSIEDDALDLAFKDGRQNEWGWVCPACNKWQVYIWMERDGDGKIKPGGIKWDERAKRDSGDYDLDRVLSSVHIQCLHRDCGWTGPDDIKSRRKLALSGSYIPQNNNPDPKKDSWHWNALTVYWIEYKTLVAEWIKAQLALQSGNHELLKLFNQQRLARMWQNRERVSVQSLRLSGYSWVDYSDGRKVEHERVRFMTIDFQKHNIRVNIRAWKDGTFGSMLLRYEIMPTFDDARRLQLQYNIPNDCVFVDLRFNSGEGARQLTRWQTTDAQGRILDWGWTGVMGEGNKDHFDYVAPGAKRPVQRPFSSFQYSITEEGKRYRYLFFSTLRIKDILSHHRTGGGNPWEVPNDVPDTYTKELDTEYRTIVPGAHGGPGKPMWLPLKKNIANHSWDTEAHQTMAACVVGVIKYTEVPILQDASAPPPEDVDGGQE